MRSYNYSDNKTIKGYVDATDAQLYIKSVPTNTPPLQFPAFLTDFSQTFDATWNTEDVFGRMDPIATYQGTKRTMSLSFDLPAASLEEAKHNLAGCSELVKMVYPVYNKGILSKPPLVRIRFANLIRGPILGGSAGSSREKTVFYETEQQRLDNLVEYGQEQTINFEDDEGEGGFVDIKPKIKSDKYGMLLGWISGLSWKPTLDMGMFASDGEFYPKIIGLSFNFNILHEQTLSQSPEIGSFPF